MADDATYCLHTLLMAPLEWSKVGEAASAIREALTPLGGSLYGAWRSQIGRPRDEVQLITRWSNQDADLAEKAVTSVLPPTRSALSVQMRPTLRPIDSRHPTLQGNYAFRQFTTPESDWPEFLDLCAGAWSDFEKSYDSQVIGLWRFNILNKGLVQSLLLTRRPNLAMWERSKIPENDTEAEVRRKLSRRYDLCVDTDVFTTTLLTAGDRKDEARWT
ncbi:MAG: hypothetical protein ACO3OM_09405 [Alphaproteobacteria bacterium]|jgi:hypothetical protein